MMFTSDLDVFLPQSIDSDDESTDRHHEKYSKLTEEERSVWSTDGKTAELVRTVVDRVSEDLTILANEPSLGLYRVHEHVRRSVPAIVARKREMADLSSKLQGMVYDVEYAITCVEGMSHVSHFSAIQKYLQQAILCKEKLNQMNKEAKDKVK